MSFITSVHFVMFGVSGLIYNLSKEGRGGGGQRERGA